MTAELSGNNIMDTLETLLQARNMNELATRFQKAVSELGDFYCVMGTMPKYRPGGLRPVLTTYPRTWIRHYLGNNYGRVDPLLRRALRSMSGFEWRSCDPISGPAIALTHDIFDLGLRNGFAVPIHGPDASVFYASFGQKQSAPTFPLRTRMALSMLVSQYYERFQQLNAAKAAQAEEGTPDLLTPRECECLTWVAHGKTSGDIGDILMLNENTVNFHLKNAQRKLQCPNRISTVIRALALGLISV
ncbi:autoinducer binding domain-containing protein [Gluconacetobacter entanii]|uniref:autoinducer binding domain-containing protein n=1 Tax=Gluconacetobacter entanii TaxID=108528 RepID=UPI001C935861|nr:autoinducer binding domain-containing protein [Gluconacetobacter entanii]MBY4638910.1 autoinducer binding domain-containing protein [Gluconacetobacter entanii]MCW4579582.1 autoinducer binding domain-containing protein [Gluconacetobacter entanii]MCW4582988.1 autoinducer binding domain-containing protein [Gluconacetobacter entanii]MCW4586382.1 autoinducer binding domain-containing protein [Gluconacetobacter entanii]